MWDKLILARIAVFTIVVPGAGAVWIPAQLLAAQGGSPRAHLDLLHAGAIALIIAGMLVYGWCVWEFAITGKGTPAPIDAPRQLVTRGLYRYVRNPIYVGVLCVFLGEAWLFESPALLLYTVAAFVLFHLFVLLYEEPTLERKFGDRYRRYRASVPRWLPRIVPRAKATP